MKDLHKVYMNCTMCLSLKGKGKLNNTATCIIHCPTKYNAIRVSYDNDPSPKLETIISKNTWHAIFKDTLARALGKESKY